MDFDADRAMLQGPDVFERYRVPDALPKLADADLDGDVELLVMERQGTRMAMLVHQMAYHHVAQGELAGEPYLVSF